MSSIQKYLLSISLSMESLS